MRFESGFLGRWPRNSPSSFNRGLAPSSIQLSSKMGFQMFAQAAAIMCVQAVFAGTIAYWKPANSTSRYFGHLTHLKQRRTEICLTDLYCSTERIIGERSDLETGNETFNPSGSCPLPTKNQKLCSLLFGR